MSEVPTDQRMGRSRKRRVLWLSTFVIIAGAFGTLVLRDLGSRPSVRLSNGTLLMFRGITQPTTSPAAPGIHVAPLRHVAPDEESSWWQRSYQRLWAASPEWLKRHLTAPLAGTFRNFDDLWRSQYGVPNYRLWFASSGPEFPFHDWSVDVNCDSMGWSYGTESGTLILDGKTITPSQRIWLRVDLRGLPAKDVRHVILKLTSLANGSIVETQIPNPNYEAVSKQAAR